MERIRENIKEFIHSIQNLLFWIFVASLMGIVLGFVGGIFVRAISHVTSYRNEHSWVILLLPVAGIIIVWLYKTLGKDKTNGGTNLVLTSISENTELPFRLAPLIFISALLSHFTGASVGRSSAALQLGGSTGSKIASFLKVNERTKKVFIMVGMSSAFAALFGTPLAASIFAIEVISVGIMHYAAFIPCLFAAIFASNVSRLLGNSFDTYTSEAISINSVGTLLIIILFGILCSFLSRAFMGFLRQGKILFQKIENSYLRIIIAGVILAGLTFCIGSQAYNGAGVSYIEKALNGDVHWYSFLLKMLFTVISDCAGYQGGDIIPSLYIGGTFGAIFAKIFGLSISGFGSLGMSAMFCAVTNCPITSILISFELFGYQNITIMAIVIAISYMTSGYNGIFPAQKNVYSKTKLEFINKKNE